MVRTFLKTRAVSNWFMKHLNWSRTYFVTVGLWQHYDSGTWVIELWNQVTWEHFCQQDKTAPCSGCSAAERTSRRAAQMINDSWCAPSLQCPTSCTLTGIWIRYFLLCIDTAEFAWIFIAYSQWISTNESMYSHRKGKIYKSRLIPV